MKQMEIKIIKISNDKFVVDKNILKEIEKSEINFLSKELKEVHLKIQNSAKEYFLRKKVLSNMKIEQRIEAGIPDGLIRVSVGLEHIDEIIYDIESALKY